MDSTPIPPTPSSLGTLGTLPRELRAQIYSHVLPPSYIFFTYDYFCDPVVERRDADLPILRLSSAINAEVSADLFSMSTFIFAIGFFDRVFTGLSSPLLTRNVTKKIQNVKFVVVPRTSVEAVFIEEVERGPQSEWCPNVIPMVTSSGEVRDRRTLYHSKYMDPLCELSIEHFAGCDVERNELSVVFRDLDTDFHLFMSTRFFQTLKTCTRFRTIKAVAECWKSVFSRRGEDIVMGEVVEKVKKELEGCWGDCVVDDVIDRYKDSDVELWFATEMVFRPLRFCGQKAV